eukprot:scaffold46048_cov27-Tisochrysis_lutea.AAC.2
MPSRAISLASSNSWCAARPIVSSSAFARSTSKIFRKRSRSVPSVRARRASRSISRACSSSRSRIRASFCCWRSASMAAIELTPIPALPLAALTLGAALPGVLVGRPRGTDPGRRRGGASIRAKVAGAVASGGPDVHRRVVPWQSATQMRRDHELWHCWRAARVTSLRAFATPHARRAALFACDRAPYSFLFVEARPKPHFLIICRSFASAKHIESYGRSSCLFLPLLLCLFQFVLDVTTRSFLSLMSSDSCREDS